MIYKILRYVIALLMGIMCFVAVENSMPFLEPILDAKLLSMKLLLGFTLLRVLAFVVGGIVGAIIGYLIAPMLLNLGMRISKNLERLLSRVPNQELMAGTVGLLFGLIIANLIGYAFSSVPFVGPYIPIVLSAILGYLGMRVMARKGPDLYVTLVSTFRIHSKEKTKEPSISGETSKLAVAPYTEDGHFVSKAKLLDTSVIIDGRIAELCRTGFLEGPLVAPLFVLEELQHISDSSDTLKRNRGRRGLDILHEMQQEKLVEVKVIDTDYDDITEVDSKLMRLALEMNWKIITNDFNLNKVATLQGIHVLNLNELANALKPALISGEWIRVQVIKEGKEDNQGIAYLDDGTMIVIENGAKYVDLTIDVMVTSILQTSAGRMIFARAEGAKND